MRSEEFERIRRSLEIDHASSPVPGFNPDMPWDAVFARAVCSTSRDFWDQEVKDKALVHLVQTSTASSAGPAVANRQEEGPPRKRARGNKQQNKGKGQGKGQPGKWGKGSFNNGSNNSNNNAGNTAMRPNTPGNNICWAWNSDTGCSDPCPNGRIHACRACGNPGHKKGATVCPKGAGKGKGKAR